MKSMVVVLFLPWACLVSSMSLKEVKNPEKTEYSKEIGTSDFLSRNTKNITQVNIKGKDVKGVNIYGTLYVEPDYELQISHESDREMRRQFVDSGHETEENWTTDDALSPEQENNENNMVNLLKKQDTDRELIIGDSFNHTIESNRTKEHEKHITYPYDNYERLTTVSEVEEEEDNYHSTIKPAVQNQYNRQDKMKNEKDIDNTYVIKPRLSLLEERHMVGPVLHTERKENNVSTKVNHTDVEEKPSSKTNYRQDVDDSTLHEEESNNNETDNENGTLDFGVNKQGNNNTDIIDNNSTVLLESRQDNNDSDGGGRNSSELYNDEQNNHDPTLIKEDVSYLDDNVNEIQTSKPHANRRDNNNHKSHQHNNNNSKTDGGDKYSGKPYNGLHNKQDPKIININDDLKGNFDKRHSSKPNTEKKGSGKQRKDENVNLDLGVNKEDNKNTDIINSNSTASLEGRKDNNSDGGDRNSSELYNDQHNTQDPSSIEEDYNNSEASVDGEHIHNRKDQIELPHNADHLRRLNNEIEHVQDLLNEIRKKLNEH